VTLAPLDSRSRAAAKPAKPAPATITDVFLSEDIYTEYRVRLPFGELGGAVRSIAQRLPRRAPAATQLHAVAALERLTVGSRDFHATVTCHGPSVTAMPTGRST
jgi:hypothetical protein